MALLTNPTPERASELTERNTTERWRVCTIHDQPLRVDATVNKWVCPTDGCPLWMILDDPSGDDQRATGRRGVLAFPVLLRLRTPASFWRPLLARAAWDTTLVVVYYLLLRRVEMAVALWLLMCALNVTFAVRYPKRWQRIHPSFRLTPFANVNPGDWLAVPSRGYAAKVQERRDDGALVVRDLFDKDKVEVIQGKPDSSLYVTDDEGLLAEVDHGRAVSMNRAA